MKISTLLKGLGFLAVAADRACAQNNYMNITICNKFPKNSLVNATVQNQEQEGGINIQPNTCDNIYTGNTEIFDPSYSGYSTADLYLNANNHAISQLGSIMATGYNDMILSTLEEYIGCAYRTSKNTIDITPQVEWSCQPTYPSKFNIEDEKIEQNTPRFTR